jgi:hypothetical protein
MTSGSTSEKCLAMACGNATVRTNITPISIRQISSRVSQEETSTAPLPRCTSPHAATGTTVTSITQKDTSARTTEEIRPASSS